MSISNEQIVLSLIAYYKNRGIDMAGLLSDPVFQSLKTAEKVEAIKAHAQTIVNHSVPVDKMNKGMKANLIADSIIGGFGGAAAGVTAGKLARNAVLANMPNFNGIPFGHNPSAWKATLATGLAGAAVGSLLGATSSYVRSTAAQAHRKELMGHLHNAASNPNDVNAVGVLSTYHNPNRSNPILNRLTGFLADKINESTESSYRTLPHLWIQNYNQYAPQEAEPNQ